MHSTDGGGTYANKNNGLVGLAVTDLDFLSPAHGFATTINSRKICSVLEYTANCRKPQTRARDPY